MYTTTILHGLKHTFKKLLYSRKFSAGANFCIFRKFEPSKIWVNFDLITHGEDQIWAASVLPNLWAAYPETLISHTTKTEAKKAHIPGARSPCCFILWAFLARYAKICTNKNFPLYSMYCNVLLKLKMICMHCNVLLKLKMICMLILPSTILISVKRKYN